MRVCVCGVPLLAWFFRDIGVSSVTSATGERLFYMRIFMDVTAGSGGKTEEFLKDDFTRTVRAFVSYRKDAKLSELSVRTESAAPHTGCSGVRRGSRFRDGGGTAARAAAVAKAPNPAPPSRKTAKKMNIEVMYGKAGRAVG